MNREIKKKWMRILLMRLVGFGCNIYVVVRGYNMLQVKEFPTWITFMVNFSIAASLILMVQMVWATLVEIKGYRHMIVNNFIHAVINNPKYKVRGRHER